MRFELVAEYFEKIEGVSSRLEMTAILQEFLHKVPAKEMRRVIYLCQGRLAPAFENLEIGMGEKFVMEAIAKTSGFERKEVEKKFKELGDLGLVAEEFAKKKRQKALYSEELSLDKVFANLKKIATSSGTGSQDLKIKLLSELLNSSNSLEAKFITRVPIGNLRLGVGDPTIMDAFALMLSKEFRKENLKVVEELEKELKEKKEEKRSEELDRKVKVKIRELIEEKYNIHSDLGSIAEILKEHGLKGLEKIEITPGIPLRPTLAERLSSAEEIIEKLGKCAVEAKYDGFRLQIHKKGNEVHIFSRHSENMTEMFPDIVKAVREEIKAKDAIFEGEALAYNETAEEFYSFQVTIQRKRKYDIQEKSLEFPLRLFCFDLMFLNGKDLMPLPFKERREKLEEVIGKGKIVELTKSIITDSAKELEKFFEQNVSAGLEGIIAKDLNAKYIAGARKFAWIKLKRSYKGELQDSLDCVILGYFKGRGQRTEFGLGALLTGVYDEAKDEFATIAKVGTGMSEDKMVELEKMLSKIKERKKPARVFSNLEPDVWVTPIHVIEIRADEITKSPVHSCSWNGSEGLALRFPRLISMRSDKKAEECSSVKEVKKMFESQKKQKTSFGEGEEK
ncbi:MAG: ATP-dependent DNA ligase [Candidatus Diapherotrites archaeon]|nr:ATP-dependent DNA ligase [Candidatus Diapherotrites archaeon]